MLSRPAVDGAAGRASPSAAEAEGGAVAGGGGASELEEACGSAGACCDAEVGEAGARPGAVSATSAIDAKSAAPIEAVEAVVWRPVPRSSGVRERWGIANVRLSLAGSLECG